MIKFGQSTRDWLVGGPAELMPEERPSKAQRLEARLLKVRPVYVANNGCHDQYSVTKCWTAELTPEEGPFKAQHLEARLL